MATTEQQLPSPPRTHLQSQHSEARYFQSNPLISKGDAQFDSLSPCIGGGSAKSSKRRAKRKQQGVVDVCCSFIVEHQVTISLALLSLLASIHLSFPSLRHHTRKYFELQYYNAASGQYMRGPDDIYYVLTWIVIFTGLREVVMTRLLRPLAQTVGIREPKKNTRFTEQAWLVIYYTIFWSIGVYIWSTSPYYLNLTRLWTDFPVLHIEPLTKAYYLIQFAFWLEQIIVVNIEERRKDHWQMFTHHIVTCMLMITSYGYYETRAGNVILCIMDIVDITFPTAKLLKYAGYQKACDCAFGLFIVSWLLFRHLAYIAVVWSMWRDVPNVMTYGCYSPMTGEMLSVTPPENSRFSQATDSSGQVPPGGTDILQNLFQPFSAPGETLCYNNKMMYVFLVMLIFLQGIMVMWFMMILRVAWNVIMGKGADDSRSDDEGDEDEEAEMEIEQTEPIKMLRPVEQVVGVESLNIKRKGSPASSRFTGVRKEQGSSSSIFNKEILNRIGCETHVE